MDISQPGYLYFIGNVVCHSIDSRIFQGLPGLDLFEDPLVIDVGWFGPLLGAFMVAFGLLVYSSIRFTVLGWESMRIATSEEREPLLGRTSESISPALYRNVPRDLWLVLWGSPLVVYSLFWIFLVCYYIFSSVVANLVFVVKVLMNW
jgi:hypothetical protein